MSLSRRVRKLQHVQGGRGAPPTRVSIMKSAGGGGGWREAGTEFGEGKPGARSLLNISLTNLKGNWKALTSLC